MSEGVAHVLLGGQSRFSELASVDNSETNDQTDAMLFEARVDKELKLDMFEVWQM